MLSKVFSTTFSGLFRSQPSMLSNSFTFCTSTGQRYEHHPLRNKIMSLSSFDQFNSFFKEKKGQFDPACYSMASRTLAKILIESKLIFNYANREALKVYLTHLQKIDIDALNLQQFSQLLYLLRIIKLDPNNNSAFVGQFVRSILDRSVSKMKELESETSLNRLSYFYQEYSSLGARQASTLARKINSILRQSNSEVEFQHLTVSEISLILKGMRSKIQISNDEIHLLKNIVKTVVQKYFDKLSFFELAQVSVGVNEVNSANINDMISMSMVEQIHRKVLSNIDQMDEKSIMFILNGKKTNNRTYNQIYRIIFEKVLDEIQPNGESSFNELFTLRLFNGISDKVKLSSTTPENQQKFFTFFRQTISKTPRFVHSFLQSYIQKGFFNNKHILRVQEILEALPEFNFRLSLLHALIKRRVNVEKLLNLDRLKDIEIKDRNLVMMTAIIESMADRQGPNKEKYIEFLSKLKERFVQLYKVEDETFSKLIFALDTDLIETLYKVFRKQIESNLPNPLQTEQSERYRAAWLKLYIHGNTETVFVKKYSNVFKEKLTAKDMEGLFRSFMMDGYSNTDAISNLLTLVAKRLDLILANDQLLNSLCRLMNLEIAKIFETGSSEILKNRYWYIISESFDKAEPAKFFEYFASVINVILKSTTYEFRYSSQYQSFLTRILQKAQFIRGKYMANDVLDECLKLNLIKRVDIPNLNQNLRDNTTTNHKLMLKMIETNEFVLEGVEMSKSNLHLFLYNLSPQTFSYLNKNKQKVTAIIEQLKARQAWKCLIHYRLGSKRQQAQIVDALFKQLNKHTLYFEEFSPIYLAEVLRRNSFDKFYVKMDNARVFFQNALEYFSHKRNIHKMPLEDHIELIKSANDFKTRNDEYVHAIFDRFSGDINIHKRELYLVAGNIGLTLNQKEIQRLIEHNFFTGFHSSFSKCFNIFLLNHKQIPDANTHLQNLISKYNEYKAKEKVPIYSLHYEYLRKTFPEETKDWQPNHIEKADFCRSLETLNSKHINSLRQVIEDITKDKWVENVVANNYYYTFRNIAFIFPFQSKYHGENLLNKKIITALTGIEKIALINRRQTNTRSAIRFLNQSFNDIFTVEEETQIMKKLEHKFEQIKTPEEEQEHEEVAQVAEGQKTEEQPKI